jgi:hypothetical protein
MRMTLIAAAAVAGIGILGLSNATAAPANGVVIGSAASAGLLSDQVHCRWYPHRHRNNIPHGWGRGCGKPKPRT